MSCPLSPTGDNNKQTRGLQAPAEGYTQQQSCLILLRPIMAAFVDRGTSGLAGSDPARESISTKASVCESHFDKVLRLLRSNHEDEIYLAGLSRLQQRFKDWAGYLGVFASGNGSLDQRLKRHPQHRDLVVYALNMLKGNLLQSTYQGLCYIGRKLTKLQSWSSLAIKTRTILRMRTTRGGKPKWRAYGCR